MSARINCSKIIMRCEGVGDNKQTNEKKKRKLKIVQGNVVFQICDEWMSKIKMKPIPHNTLNKRRKRRRKLILPKNTSKFTVNFLIVCMKWKFNELQIKTNCDQFDFNLFIFSHVILFDRWKGISWMKSIESLFKFTTRMLCDNLSEKSN